MSLAQPRIFYGIHSIAPKRRTDGLPYGILKVIGSCSLALSADLELLYAGSNKAPWAAESKTLSTEISAKVKAYPGFLFELFLGATVTDNAADSAGSIEVFANKYGSTVKDAVNGISAVGVIPTTGAANLKFGKYVLKATDTDTVKIYLLSDVDIKRGTDATYVDDTLEVGSVDISSATNDVAALGLRFTKTGTPAFTVGDTATFEVRTPSSKSSKISVGSSSSTFPAFAMIMMGQKRSTNEFVEIEAHQVIANGLPMAFEENAFSQPEVKMQCLYDATEDEIFEIRTLTEA